MLNFDEHGNISVTLIDFGFAKRYKNGSEHIKNDTKLKRFNGNILFASLNQLNFSPTSRVDDLYSIMYLLFYLFNDCDFPDLGKIIICDQDYPQEDLFCLMV